METYPVSITITDVRNNYYEIPTAILMSDGVTEYIDWTNKRDRNNILKKVVATTKFIDLRKDK